MQAERKNLYNKQGLKVDTIADSVELYTLSGEYIKISKADFQQICKKYIATELAKYKGAMS